MDYKLIRRTVAVCSLSVLAILGIVFWMNRFDDRGGQPRAASAEISQTGDMGSGQQAKPEGTPNGAEQDASAQGDMSAANGQEFYLGGDTRAFLRDESFWDDEPQYTSGLDVNAVRLSLIATSVQRDLRLQIVDADGALVTGQPFFIEVEGVGSYKDLDRDGIVYIRDLGAGDYRVSVAPIEGYHVSTSYMNVHVNDKVEYKEISDIDLLIVSEDEIDKREEEAREREMNEDRDDTEHTELLTGMDTAVMGMDISSFNGEIDWEKVKEQGIGFVIIRCGYRGYTSGALVEDACFVRNISEANKAGVRVGVYFFTQALNEVEAVEEASMVIALCRDYRVDLPIFIDTETAAGGAGRADMLDNETRTTVLKAFLETIESAGYRAGVYASKNWFYERVDHTQLTDYLTWLAEYKDEPTYDGSFQFWQYTSRGYVNGVTGRVDLNLGSLSLSDISPLWRQEEVQNGNDPDAQNEGETGIEGAGEGTGAGENGAEGEAGAGNPAETGQTAQEGNSPGNVPQAGAEGGSG